MFVTLTFVRLINVWFVYKWMTEILIIKIMSLIPKMCMVNGKSQCIYIYALHDVFFFIIPFTWSFSLLNFLSEWAPWELIVHDVRFCYNFTAMLSFSVLLLPLMLILFWLFFFLVAGHNVWYIINNYYWIRIDIKVSTLFILCQFCTNCE